MKDVGDKGECTIGEQSIWCVATLHAVAQNEEKTYVSGFDSSEQVVSNILKSFTRRSDIFLHENGEGI